MDFSKLTTEEKRVINKVASILFEKKIDLEELQLHVDALLRRAKIATKRKWKLVS